MYYDTEGRELVRSEIEKAVEEGRAVLRWSHDNWKNVASLYICEDAEEAEMEASRDTRGECWSMADEVWSETPDRRQALLAAKGLLTTT